MNEVNKLHEQYFIKHPTQKYKIDQLAIANGVVQIIEYSDGTVIVQTIEADSPVQVWCNMPVYLDAETNEIMIIRPPQ